jgi:hypothetical protein
VPSELQVDEFDGLGWVRVTDIDGKGRKFAVTGDGRQAWAKYVAERSHVPGRVDLEWPAARYLLEQIYEQYLDRGAPAHGVDILPLTSDENTGRQAEAIIQELARSGWLDVPYASANGPRSVRPSPEALQLLAPVGRPTARKRSSAGSSRRSMQRSTAHLKATGDRCWCRYGMVSSAQPGTLRSPTSRRRRGSREI